MTAPADLSDMVTDPEAVELTVPANAEHLSTARLFAAAAARHFGAAEDAVEDLRLAVSETCTFVLQSSEAPSALRVIVRPLPEGVAVRISTVAEPARPSEPAPADETWRAGPANGWGTDLLQALVDDLAFEPQADGQLNATFVFAFDRTTRDPGDDAGLAATSGEQAASPQG